MKYLNGRYYVEVKDHRYKIHPTEKIILRKRNPPTALRTQYQVQNETKIRRNQKVIKNDNDQLIVKNYPKNKQPTNQQQKFKPPNCPSCKRSNWLEFYEGYFCQICEYTINKQKHQIDKKVFRQDHDFSTRLIYANKKIREIWMNMVNTTYNSTEDMIEKLQQLKDKTKLKIYKNITDYYIEMKNRNFQTQEDPFSKNAQGVSKMYHEVLLLMKFLQTKPQVKNMNNTYFDLYFTVLKTINDNEIVNDNENDYINFNDNITPNHYIGIKPRETLLR